MGKEKIKIKISVKKFYSKRKANSYYYTTKAAVCQEFKPFYALVVMHNKAG